MLAQPARHSTTVAMTTTYLIDAPYVRSELPLLQSCHQGRNLADGVVESGARRVVGTPARRRISRSSR